MRARTDAPTNAEVYGKLLQAVDKRVDRDQLRALIKRMESSHHVYLRGYNLSRIPAEELCIALQFQPGISASTPQVDVMPRFHEDDLLLVYSAVSGASLKDLLNEFRMGRFVRPHMVLVTTNSKHPMRRSFDEVFVLPTVTLASTSRTVLSDTFAFLMFNDILATVAAAARENSSD